MHNGAICKARSRRQSATAAPADVTLGFGLLYVMLGGFAVFRAVGGDIARSHAARARAFAGEIIAGLECEPFSANRAVQPRGIGFDRVVSSSIGPAWGAIFGWANRRRGAVWCLECGDPWSGAVVWADRAPIPYFV